VAEVTYNRGATRILAGDTPLDSADLRMLVIVGASLPAGWNNPDLNTVADLDAVTGLTIHSERLALASKTVTQDDTNNRANADAANLSFAAAASTTAQAVVIYDEGGGADATRYLVSGHSTGFPQPMDGGLNVNITDWLRGNAG
jgi:hypothetical protein